MRNSGKGDPTSTDEGTLLMAGSHLCCHEECSSSQAYPGWVNDRMICAGMGRLPPEHRVGETVWKYGLSSAGPCLHQVNHSELIKDIF